MEGTGYEVLQTSMEQTNMKIFILQTSSTAVHSVLFWVHLLLMITNAKRFYWLVPQAVENSSRDLSQKKQTKTDNFFFRFYIHSPLLTML